MHVFQSILSGEKPRDLMLSQRSRPRHFNGLNYKTCLVLTSLDDKTILMTDAVKKEGEISKPL